MNGLTDTILKMMDTTQEPEDYKGEDGLLYCGKCHKPKEAYFPQGKALFGRDRHPSECDCRRAERERLEKGGGRKAQCRSGTSETGRLFQSCHATLDF